MNRVRRNNIEIIIDILKEVKYQELSKTAVVYKTNLNFNRANIYLTTLIDMGLIEKVENKYWITDMGNDYLTKVKDLDMFFKTLQKIND